MKIGMNMLLWTGHVTQEHLPVLHALKDTGFDGVEVPIFETSDIEHYYWLAGVLDDLGLARSCVCVIPDEAHSPLSDDPAARAYAVDHLARVIECAFALGATHMAGPWFQPLGVFSGDKPSEAELARCADVHRQIMPIMRAAGITAALEPLNRFEAYLLNTVEQSIAYSNNLAEAGFGILYDTFHANIEERDPIAALLHLHGSGWLTHVHISENDRGVPGFGHAKIRESIHALRALNYQGWLTIEAFGPGLPELAVATRIWRDLSASPEEIYTEGYRYIRQCWAEAA